MRKMKKKKKKTALIHECAVPVWRIGYPYAVSYSQKKKRKNNRLIIYSIRFFGQLTSVFSVRVCPDVNELNNAILKEKLHAFLLSIRLHVN